jgi:hypothetical protein
MAETAAHVLFSHGMGDKKDSRIYRGIKEAFSPRGYEFHTFSYDIEHDNGDTTVRNFQDRPPILEAEIKKLQQIRKIGEKLIFVGHSQGCLPLGFVDRTPFDQVVFLNAMVSGGNDGMKDTLSDESKDALKEVDETTMMPWPLKDADGKPYISNVPLSYFRSMHFDRFAAYQQVSESISTKVFVGTADNMTGLIGKYKLDNAEYHSIEGGRHNFLNREKQLEPELIEKLGKYVFEQV